MANKVLHRVTQGFTYAGDTDLIVMTCPTCGVSYAMPYTMQQNAFNKGERAIVWYCPNGHELGYNGPSEEQRARERAEAKARRATERANAERDLRIDTEHRLRAQKGATTRAKKRHANGICPCCNRSFANVRRHMETQHPDYDPAK